MQACNDKRCILTDERYIVDWLGLWSTVIRSKLQRTGDPFGPLARDLPAALNRSGATVEEQGGAGIAELRVPVASFNIDTLSVGATARVREYAIRYHVEFEAIDGDGKPVLDKQVIELSRDYSFDETQALGIAAQEEEFKKDMERDMVAAMLRRLEAAGRAR